MAQIEFRQLVGYSVDELFAFNKKFGSTPHNFIPDGPVREHLASPNTIVWGGVRDGKLVGFITAERGTPSEHLNGRKLTPYLGGCTGSEYWMATGPGDKKTAFIHEFVVDPSIRGQGLGTKLASLSVDPKQGIFGIDSSMPAIMALKRIPWSQDTPDLMRLQM